jgi:hypothetical protein
MTEMTREKLKNRRMKNSEEPLVREVSWRERTHHKVKRGCPRSRA